MYASYAEDVKLRKDKWDKHFPPELRTRAVMHDNTNIPLPTPSDADLNRALFSKYYGEPVGKGGVGIQFCGWIVALHLVTGAIPDSPYIALVKILLQQKIFQENDKTSEKGFVNILDKGYRITLAANNEGQSCLQPIFSKSEEQFTRNKMLHSASST